MNVTLSAAQANLIFSASSAIAGALAAVPVVDDAQLDLFGSEQALEAFMDEREDLKAQNATNLAIAQSAILAATVALDQRDAAISEVEGLEDILVQSARYHLKLRECLAAIGVTFETDATGGPAITLDLPALVVAIEGQLAV